MDQRRLQERIDNEWLGLGDTSLIQVKNRLLPATRQDLEDPVRHLVKVIRDPDNFYFTCKNVLGITLAPFQLAILQEMWRRPFPMLIGARGAGKCVRGDTLVMTDCGICPIEQLAEGEAAGVPAYPNRSVFGEQGHKPIDYAWNNGFGPTIKLTTGRGYFIEGTPDHPIRVAGRGGPAWKELKDVNLSDRVVIDRTESWFTPRFELEPDVAYLFGLITGDGGFTRRGSITITSADKEIVDSASAIATKLWGKPFRKIPSAKYGHLLCGVKIWQGLFDTWGFPSSVCAEKGFPSSVLGASKEAMRAFIQGLMDTDGSVEDNRTITFCSKSIKLARTLQFVLTRFGIISGLRARHNKKYRRDYFQVTISGKDARAYTRKIGFRLARKAKLAEALCDRKTNVNLDTVPDEVALDDLCHLSRTVDAATRRACGVARYHLQRYGITYEKLARVLPHFPECSQKDSLQTVTNANLYYDTVKKIESGWATTYDVHVPDGHSFVSNGLVSHNTFILALYSVLRMMLCQGVKVIVVGAAFRQSKLVFEYCESLWNNSPVLRDLCGNDKKNGPRRDIDRCTMRLGESLLTAIPVGDGGKIRGFRSNITIADEFHSHSEEIFENVIQGFGSVSMAPVEKMKAAGRRRARKDMGLLGADAEAPSIPGLTSNQTILSGTAYYAFNHFYRYWLRYKGIVESRGDPEALERLLGGPPPAKFDWRDYSVIRIPASLLPEGFMDEKVLARARATVHLSQYGVEYDATFAKDSSGFFKRSLIEACVVGKPGCDIGFTFQARLRGGPDCTYVMGVDPAAKHDSFAVVLVECHEGHRRVVYCWTTNKKNHAERLKRGLTQDSDFYSFVARKIRDLLGHFNCARVAIDTQGGGFSVMEALADPNRLKPKEVPILPVVDEEKEQPTDDLEGDHILVPVSFAKSDWVSQANHGMRKDFEDRALLFPEDDAATLGMAVTLDEAVATRIGVNLNDGDGLYDTMTDCLSDIFELKEEISTIQHTQTGVQGRDHFDTPEVKEPGGKKGRLRKDRYSALLMANMVARQMAMERPKASPVYFGGNAADLARNKGGPAVARNSPNPDWYNRGLHGKYGAVRRGGVEG